MVDKQWVFGKVTKTTYGWQVNSFTEANTVYLVQETPGEVLWCNCPAYQHQHKDSCKHTEAVEKYRGQNA